MAQSEKPPSAGIGHKGVGFKSVLQVCPTPQIFSASEQQDAGPLSGFRFTFPDEDRYETLIPRKRPARMTPYSLPEPIALERQPVSVRELAAAGYVTVVRLPLRADAVAKVDRALDDVLAAEAPILLFLDRIRELHVTRVSQVGATVDAVMTRERRVRVAGDGCVVSELDLGDRGRHLLVEGAVAEDAFKAAVAADVAQSLIDEQWSTWSGPAPIAIALPLGHDAADDRLYCYLPLAAGAQSPVAGHANAPFAVGLARKGLIDGSAVNRVLLDGIARVSVAAVLAIDEPDLYGAAVDLVAWPRDRDLVTEAWQASGRDLTTMELLPTLATAGRGSFATVHRFDGPGCLRFTPSAVVAMAGARLLDPGLGANRIAAVLSFAADALRTTMEPPDATLAAWAVAIAAGLPPKPETGADFEAWLEYYDDLPKVFLGASGRALAGMSIVLGEDGEILPAWSETPSGVRRRVRGIFFQSREGDGTEAWEGRVPRSLRGAIARVHPGLDWYLPGDTIRRNRPGRTFLEQVGLVRVTARKTSSDS